MFNLIEDKWIPIERQSGLQTLIAPHEITSNYHEDPIIKIIAPRQDLSCALIEFLIGLFQTSNLLQSEQISDWLDQLISPPSPENLYAALVKHRNVFQLIGEGPCFLQNCELTQAKKWPIEKLLFGSPGDNTIKENRDFFIKRKTTEVLCPSCTAAALFNLQAHVGGGGAGHVGSLRGAGPLVSFIRGRSLWETIWSNILPQEEVQREILLNSHKEIFPWLKPKQEKQTQFMQDVHPYHVYWGMPRAIYLRPYLSLKNCDLCNRQSNILIDHFMTDSNGINYDGYWEHPLSPQVGIKEEGGSDKSVFIFQSAKLGTISYQHWLPLIKEKNNLYKPARVISYFHSKRRRASVIKIFPEFFKSFQLMAFGYELDKDKTLTFHHKDFLLLDLSETNIQAKYEEYLEDGVNIAKHWEKKLCAAVSEIKKGSNAIVRNMFWKETENDFFGNFVPSLKQWLQENSENDELPPMLEIWNKKLNKKSLQIFDLLFTSGVIEYEDTARIVKARHKLNMFKFSKTLSDYIGKNYDKKK